MMKKIYLAFLNKFVLVLAILLFIVGSKAHSQIISQYVETNSGSVPKGIEILNNTAGTLNFATNNLVIQQGTNGAAPVTVVTVNTGTLLPGAVMVIGTSDIGTYLTGQSLTCTFVTFAFNFNGDDALQVRYGATITDIFLQPGTDPGASWSGSGVSTENQNIQLIPSITIGASVAYTDPSTRFTTVSTTPATLPAGLTGFGVSPSVTKYWDASTINTNVGGSATWGTTFSLSALGDNPLISAISTDNIIYTGDAGTVTLDASQTAASHTIKKDYSIATSAPTITFTGPITVDAGFNLTFAPATTNTLTIPGIISSAGNIIQNGLGTSILTGVNTYTGTTAISGGVLNIQSATALGTTAAGTTITNGAALEIQGGITVGAEALGIGGTGISSNGALRNISGTNVYGGTLTLSGATTIQSDAGSLTLNNANAITGTQNLTIEGAAGGTISGTITTGTGTLTKNDAGSWILSGANTYTGTTSIAAGVLNIQNATALGTIAAGTSITSGAALEIQGGITVGAEALGIGGTGISSNGALRNISGTNVYGGTLTLSAATTIQSDLNTLTLNNANAITGVDQNLTIEGAAGGTISGTITIGTGTLTKNDAGSWILSGANTYTGTTSIAAGVLNVQNATALGTTAAGTTITSGAVLEIQGGITVGAEALGIGGTGISSNGALRNISGTNVYGGTLTLSAATTIQSDAGSLTLSASNAITGTNQNLTLEGASGGTISGTITTGTGTLTKNDAGTWILSATNNTYTGTTTINAGTLTLSGSTLASAINVVSGTLSSSGTAGTSGSLTVSGAVSPGGSAVFGNLSVGGAMTWNNGGSYQLDMNALPSGGTAGVNWDFITAAGNMITPASGSFTVALNGNIALFDDNINNTWQIGSYSGGTPLTTFIAVSKTGLNGGLITGTFTITFTGGNSINLVYTKPSPTISTTGSLSAVSTTYGTASGNTSFSVSGSTMDAAITITPPAGFQVSTTIDFSSNVGTNAAPITVGAAGTISATTIYVRLAATAVVGSYNSLNIVLTSTNASTVNVATTASGNAVAAKALTITGLTAADKEYDRLTTVSVSGTPAYSGLVNGETFSMSGSVTWAFADVNVGLSKVLTRTGSYTAPSTNYTVTQPSLTATISAKALTVSGATANNKSYNGTNAATITGATLAGVISPDAVTVSGGGTFASVNVGTGIVVTASLALGGADAGNYSITQPTGLSANITAIAPTYTISTIAIAVGGTYALPGANVSSNSAGTLTYTLGTPAPVGSVTLTGSTLNGIAAGSATLTVNQAANGNYTAGSTTVTVNVTAVVYVHGDFRTKSAGKWTYNAVQPVDATLWERYNSTIPGWEDFVGQPNTSPEYTAYITQNTEIPTNATVHGRAKIIVTKDAVTNIPATLTFNPSANWTFRNVIIEDGSTIDMQTIGFNVLASRDFEIKDGGNFWFNFSSTAAAGLTGSLWQGVEKFHPNSNFRVKNHQTGANNYFLPPAANLTLFTNINNGVDAYFGNLIIESAGEVRMTTTNLSSTTTYLTHNNLEFKTSIFTSASLFFGNGTWIVGKDLIFNSGSTGNLTVTTSGNTINLNAKGNFTNNSNNVFRLANNAGAAVTLNVDGNLTLNNTGSLDLNFTSGGSGTVNLKGDLQVASGATLLANNGTTAIFNFNGLGDGSDAANTQTIDVENATTASNISFVALSGYVKLIDQDFALGTNSKFTVNSGAVLDFGFTGTTALNLVRVGGQISQSFDAKDGSRLKITSPLGIVAQLAADYTGNVQIGATAGERLFGTSAIYHYIGKANQVSGNGLPGAVSAKKVIVEMDDVALTFQPTGLKQFNATGEVEIRKGIVLDNSTGAFSDGSLPGETGKLKMSGGRYRLFLTGTNPGLSGTYALSAGVVEFASSQLTTQTIRGKAYQNIEVTGDNVGNSAALIQLNSTGGNLTVKTGGKLFMSDIAITASASTNTCTVVVENGATFGCASSEGFSGYATTSPPNRNSSIHQNIAGSQITLATGSTVDYYRTSAQLISNEIPYKNLTISGTGNKTAPSGTLTIQGNLLKTNSTSTFVHNNGTVLFNSTTAVQSFTNSSSTAFNFYDLTNSNSFNTGLNIVSDLGVVNALTLSDNSKLNVNTGNISLRSTATATARVAPINTGTIAYPNTSIGRFIVERYFPARRSWRLLTAPVSVASDASFFKTYQLNGIASASAPAGSGTYITGASPTGPTGNGLDVNPNGINNSSLKLFNPSTGLFTDVANTKTLLTSGTTGTAGTADNIGFMMFVRGDRTTSNVNAFTPLTTVNETTLSDIGKLQIYSYSFLTTPTVGKYTLIGNPYASPVDFTLLPRNNVANKFWAWDPAINVVGAYAIVDFALGDITTVPAGLSTSQTRHIQSKQAFIVETSSIATTPILAFNETSKSTTNNLLLFRPSNEKIRSLAINLHTLNNDASTNLADGALIQFREDLSNSLDTLDGLKFGNVNEMLSIQTNQKAVMLERRKPVIVGDTIFLNLSKTTEKKYRFNFMLNKMVDNNLAAYLDDRFLQTSTPVNMDGSSWLDFKVTGDAASKAPNRFRIVFKKVFTCNTISAAMHSNDIAVNWKVTGEQNIDHYQVERSTDGDHFTSIATKQAMGNNTEANSYAALDEKPTPGIYYYRIKAVSNLGAIGYSQTVEVKMMNTRGAMYVFPNPVSNGTIGLQLNAQPAGNYAVRLINALGQSMLTKTVAHAGGTASISIPYPAAFRGSYQLEVTQPDKKVKLVKIILQ